jgi:hypothetical protein
MSMQACDQNLQIVSSMDAISLAAFPEILWLIDKWSWLVINGTFSAIPVPSRMQRCVLTVDLWRSRLRAILPVLLMPFAVIRRFKVEIYCSML